MGTNRNTNEARARTQIQAYVRGLLGSNSKGSWRTASIKLLLPKGSGSGVGGTSQSLPRQLEATAYTKSVKNPAADSSGSRYSWLLPPIVSTVKSILGLFGGGNSTTQSTRFRSSSRRTFRTVESISPETGSGGQDLNESAAGLSGVVSHAIMGLAAVGKTPGSGATITASAGNGRTMHFEDRQSLVTALRRGLSESRGIADVLNEFQDGL